MRTLVVGLCLLGVLGVVSGARAEIGTPDPVPAATLLLPRFEVDLSDVNGITTLFSINNASDENVLAHVTVWSEWWVPVLSFDVYLTGYDVHTINLRDIIVNGDLPNTGPSNTLSSLGFFSVGPHSSFGGTCTVGAGTSPDYANISGLFLQVVQQSLTGQPLSTTGLCASRPGNPSLARGFVTIDAVRRCSNEFPDNVNYFVDGGDGTATNQNVLWGDYFLVDSSNNFAQGETLVHLEADGVSLGVLDGSCDTFDRNPSTFYCTLRNPTTAPGEDNREGLPSVYMTRYLLGGAFSGGTDLIGWRDKNGTGAGVYRNCATTPIPLTQTQIVVFDEQENPLVDIGIPPGGEPVIIDTPFPWGTNRAKVGTDVTVDANFGWLFLNLNNGNVSQEYFRQAHVTTILSAEGRYSVGYQAISLNNLTLGTESERGERNPDPTLGEAPNPNAPTLFDGTVTLP